MLSLNAGQNADPSRTGLLRRAFMVDVAKRTAALVDDINELDMLDDPEMATNAAEPYKFATDAARVRGFQQWFGDRVKQRFLTPLAGKPGRPWTAKYVGSGYRTGLVRAYTDTRRGTLATGDLYAGGQREFLRSAFDSPEAVAKLRKINTRVFDNLKDITREMSDRVATVLTDGLAQGDGPKKIAKALTDTVEGISRKRAIVLARTEVIHAHAEGQLDGFEELGIDELGVMAEWSIADNGACPLCQPRAGRTYTVAEARGLIPLHPGCRCAWVPSFATKPRRQMWPKRKVTA